MTAAEARKHGSATADQRAELRSLLARKCYTNEWRDQLYRDAQARGLSRARAMSAIRYLRAQTDRTDQPVYATGNQAIEIRDLVRTQLAPGPWIAPILARLAAGKLRYTDADRTIKDLTRLPARAFVVPDGPPVVVNFADGYYALTGPDGRVRHYRIHTVAGLRKVDQIIDPTNTKRRRRHRLRGHEARQVIQAVAADPRAAGRLFAETTKRCTECNRPIHDSTNPGFPHGYGPDCWDDPNVAARVADIKAEIAEAAQERADA